MLKCIKRDKQSKLERKFAEHIEVLFDEAETVEDYVAIADLIERHSDLRNKRRISRDTMAVIAGNLMGILLILEHERAHVIATKALGFVIRGRV